jgi:hypothetical protein
VQLAPYQALPVDGRITRHFTRGLPVVDPASRSNEVRQQGGDGGAEYTAACPATNPILVLLLAPAAHLLPCFLLPHTQEREQAVDAIITAYTARLRDRTRHHLG